MIPSSIIETLNDGGVVAYPTSTQPGLASLPTQQGLDALFALKQRPAHMPVSLGVESVEQAKAWPRGAFHAFVSTQQHQSHDQFALLFLRFRLVRPLVDDTNDVSVSCD